MALCVTRGNVSAKELVTCMVCAMTGASPSSIRIGRGAHGKPFFIGIEGIYFNVSHSGDWVAVCVSDVEVGIDVQCVPRLLRPSTLRRLGLPADTTPEDFALVWARREAALKARGTGFAKGFEKTLEDGLDIKCYKLCEDTAIAIAKFSQGSQ